nr:MAG TPA: hypothetical protein [Bacteriophage sp.]DAW31252.1 MAG TPA: hypothetical protein [Caudoviricetes sp.]
MGGRVKRTPDTLKLTPINTLIHQSIHRLCQGV